MAYHDVTPYKKISTADARVRTVADITSAEQTAIDTTISAFITKFKAKHLS